MSQPAWMYEEGISVPSSSTEAPPASTAPPAFLPTSYSSSQQRPPASGGTPPPLAAQHYQPSTVDSAIGGGAGASDEPSPTTYRFGDPADDLPLLEELGIFPTHIKAKAAAVLHPMKAMDPEVVEDTDLAGPMVFALVLAFLLSLQGKMQFGAIYTVSLLGICVAKGLITLMSDQPVRLQFVISTLGYCLLPNLMLAVVQTFKYWIWGTGGAMVPVAIAVIAWSGWCACQMFVAALMMQEQRYLILYPCVLFYAAFAALTIF